MCAAQLPFKITAGSYSLMKYESCIVDGFSVVAAQQMALLSYKLTLEGYYQGVNDDWMIPNKRFLCIFLLYSNGDLNF